MICEVCDKYFEPKSKAQVHCSPECRKEKRRQTNAGRKRKQKTNKLAGVQPLYVYQEYPKDHEDVTLFEYTILLKKEFRKALGSKKSEISKKFALRDALKRVNDYILSLSIKDPYRDLLILEKGYIRKLERNTLIWNIKQSLNIDHRGEDSYTLAEISDVLGVSRERIRQIEFAAMRTIVIPDNIRLLQPYLNTMEVLDVKL